MKQMHANEPTKRLQARRRQPAIEKQRLNRHVRIGRLLLAVPRSQARALVARARHNVDEWERHQLCSNDYIERWRVVLALPYRKMVEEMCGDAKGWGPALRQNSPWVRSAGAVPRP